MRTIDKNTLLDFGKHKGEKASDVPPRYIVWMHEQEGFLVCSKLYAGALLAIDSDDGFNDDVYYEEIYY
jgi:uncharacterized protein (DUF3820 family)